jgi:hypothetical protein
VPGKFSVGKFHTGLATYQDIAAWKRRYIGTSRALASFSRVSIAGTVWPFFHSGDIATEQAGSFLDVALAELLGFTEFSESFSD